ncbi:LysM domain-containing protein, partial [Colletotrichum paranaense]
LWLHYRSYSDHGKSGPCRRPGLGIKKPHFELGEFTPARQLSPSRLVSPIHYLTGRFLRRERFPHRHQIYSESGKMKNFKGVAFLVMVFAHRVVTDIRLANIPPGTPGLNDTCIGVLNQDINCNESLTWATEINYYYDSDTINSLCTPTCRAALGVYLDEVKSACETSRYTDDKNGLSYHAGYDAELAWERFNVLCATNAAGENCNLVIGKLAGINPENQQRTGSSDPSVMCNECALSVIKTQVEAPLASNADLASGLSMIASSCKTTVNVTPPPSASPAWVSVMDTPVTASTGAQAASPSCAGTKYTIKAGDTCQSVAEQQSIDTVQLLAANNLVANCFNFPTAAGSTLCIPTAAVCKPYVVKADDTCTTIANSAKATWAQIVSWNPELGRSCQNVARYVGFVVCASNPGGSWVDPNPQPTATTGSGITATSDIDTVFTLPMTPIPMNNGFTTVGAIPIWADEEL